MGYLQYDQWRSFAEVFSDAYAYSPAREQVSDPLFGTSTSFRARCGELEFQLEPRCVPREVGDKSTDDFLFLPERPPTWGYLQLLNPQDNFLDQYRYLQFLLRGIPVRERLIKDKMGLTKLVDVDRSLRLFLNLRDEIFYSDPIIAAGDRKTGYTLRFHIWHSRSERRDAALIVDTEFSGIADMQLMLYQRYRE